MSDQEIVAPSQYKRGAGLQPLPLKELLRAYHAVIAERDEAEFDGDKNLYERMDAIAKDLWNTLRKLGVFKC